MSIVAFEPAGFFARLGAFVVEHVILVLIPGAIVYTYFPEFFDHIWKLYKLLPSWIFPTVYFSYILLFNFYFIWTKETTVGKYLFKLKIRSDDNQKLTPIQIITREILSKQISSFIFYLGYLPAAFRADRKAVHDLLAKTIIIYQRKEETPERNGVSPSPVSIGIQLAVLVVALKVSYDFKEKIFGPDRPEKSLSQLPADSIYRMNHLGDDQNQRSYHRPRNIKVIPDGQKTYSLVNKTSLDSYSNEDFSRIEFQNALLDQNPTLIPKLPGGVTLQKDFKKRGSEKYYNFIDFIPPHLVDEDLKHFNKSEEGNYKLHFLKFLKEAKPDRRDDSRVALLHPDFFQDKPFADYILQECILHSSSEKYNYLNQMKFSETAISTLKSSLNEKMVSPECIPSFLLKDPDYVLQLTEKSPGFVDEFIKITDDHRLKEIKVKEIFRYNSERPDDFVSRHDPGLQSLKNYQAHVFERYWNSVKYFDEKTVFHPEELEKFIQTHFKPERFFSEYQKLQNPVKELLKKYPNNTSQHLTQYKQFLYQKLSSNELRHSSQHFINYFPEEVLADDDFHLSMIKLFHDQNYLNQLALKRPISSKIKNWIIDECKRSYRYKNLTYPMQGNEWATNDSEFQASLKVACDHTQKKDQRIEANMQTQQTMDHVRRRTQELLMKSKERTERYRSR